MLKFRLKKCPGREQAKNWLISNGIKFPTDIKNDIGPDIFHGWRFVRGLNNVMYFACGLYEGITEDEILTKKDD